MEVEIPDNGAVRLKAKPAKRRRNYAADLSKLEGRVATALVVLARVVTSQPDKAMVELAMDILKGEA